MKERFHVLDAFRGIFSFIVVFYHMREMNSSLFIQNNFVAHGYLFVDFFFVLSGFVIAYNYDNRLTNYTQLTSFLNKRFFRLFPLHIAVLLLFVGYVFFRQVIGNPATEGFDLNTFFTTLFLVNSIKFPDITAASWNMPSWSISAEMISYLAFGLLLTLTGKMRSYKTIMYLFVIAMAVVAMQLSGGSFLISYNNGFIRGMIGFFCGALTFKIFEMIKARPTVLQATILEAITLFAVIYFIIMTAFFSLFIIFYELLFMTTILVFSFEKGFVSKAILSLRIFKRLGSISYSVYMNHFLIIVGVDIFTKKFSMQSQWIDSGIVILLACIVYFVSGWTYKNIEMRFAKGVRANAPKTVLNFTNSS